MRRATMSAADGPISIGPEKASIGVAHPSVSASWSKENIRSGWIGLKFATARPYFRPEAAARKLIEIANSVEAVGQIHIELINGPFLFDLRGTPAEYTAGLKLAIDRDWLQTHESGTYVKFTQAGAEMFA